MRITPTVYLREDGIEMIQDRSTGKWYIRTVTDIEQAWYWHPKNDQWVRPFKHPSRDYLMDKELADEILIKVPHPGA
jgi:hypothetical protein